MSDYDADGNYIPQRALPPTKTADAKNRAFRTFLVSIGFDVAVAVALLLLPIFQTAAGWSDFDWTLLTFSIFKTVVISALSFFLRYFKVVPKTL